MQQRTACAAKSNARIHPCSTMCPSKDKIVFDSAVQLTRLDDDAALRKGGQYCIELVPPTVASAPNSAAYTYASVMNSAVQGWRLTSTFQQHTRASKHISDAVRISRHCGLLAVVFGVSLTWVWSRKDLCRSTCVAFSRSSASQMHTCCKAATSSFDAAPPPGHTSDLSIVSTHASVTSTQCNTKASRPVSINTRAASASTGILSRNASTVGKDGTENSAQEDRPASVGLLSLRSSERSSLVGTGASSAS